MITYLGITGLIIFSNNYLNGKIIGDLLCVIAAIGYGIYLLIIAKLGKETSLNLIFYTTFFCCLFSIPPMMLDSGINLPRSDLEWRNLFMLALVCQFGGQFLITYSIGKISPSNGSIGLLMQPVTATILATFLLNEILNSTQIIFAFITMVGIYLARLSIIDKYES
tara:strand:- start:296 stop:793 length:498 start_codon:yes stop_codon:yes gene_type:complete